MVTRLKTLLEVEMFFRNEKQSLGCLKMGLKDSWSFSHFKKKILHLGKDFSHFGFQGAKFSHSNSHRAKFSHLVLHCAKPFRYLR